MKLMADISAALNSGAWSLVKNGYVLALFSFFFPLSIDRLKRVGRYDDLARVVVVAGAVSLLPIAGWAWLYNFTGPHKSPLGAVPLEPVVYYISSFALGCAAGFAFLREAAALLDKFKARATKRTSLERNRKTDVREIRKFLPGDAPQYDPREFFDPKKGLFFGLDERRKPVYLNFDNYRIQHTLVAGRTRAFKGVAAQSILSQVARREYVVVLDPKPDDWLPQVLYSECQRAGVAFRFADINPSSPPQLNPFLGGDAETYQNMLVGGYGISEKGEAADFYRLADRKAARQLAAWFTANPGATAQDAVVEHGDVWAEEARAFGEYMRETAALAAVNASAGGLDIADGLKRGGVFYVAGDMINPSVVRTQRMMLLRLMMLAKKTNTENRRTIMVFADEFKVHISRPFMLSLGASAGWGLHCLLAFQSLQDLFDCPADLDPRAVRGAVLENCAVQLTYALKDPDTAEWLSRSTGTILVDDEMRRVNRNAALAETVSGDRSIRQAERPYVDLNMFLHLPQGCGVLSVPGTLPRFVYTSPVRVPKVPQATQITPARVASPSSDERAREAARDPLL